MRNRPDPALVSMTRPSFLLYLDWEKGLVTLPWDLCAVEFTDIVGC